MAVEHTSTIRSEERDFEVVIKTHDEHHMGASTVFTRLSRPMRGISDFQTTNGSAFFSPDGDGLFICDATTILYFDLKTEQVFSSQPPAGCNGVGGGGV